LRYTAFKCISASLVKPTRLQRKPEVADRFYLSGAKAKRGCADTLPSSQAVQAAAWEIGPS